MTDDELAKILTGFGCPSGKAMEMAQQLEKRAQQLMVQRSMSHEEALVYLLSLFQQALAAQGHPPTP